MMKIEKKHQSKTKRNMFCHHHLSDAMITMLPEEEKKTSTGINSSTALLQNPISSLWGENVNAISQTVNFDNESSMFGVIF